MRADRKSRMPGCMNARAMHGSSQAGLTILQLMSVLAVLGIVAWLVLRYFVAS